MTPAWENKHESRTCLGYLAPQQTDQLHYQPMHDDALITWLPHAYHCDPCFGNTSNFSSDVKIDNGNSVDYSLHYSPSMPLMTSFGMYEGDNGRYGQVYNNGYSNYCSSGYGGLGDPTSFDFGCFQLSDDYNGEERNSFCAFGNIHLQRRYNVGINSAQSLEFQSHLSAPTLEENTTKVGRYSAEERRDKILRYLRKRNQRNFTKTIKYACRKSLADRRVRIRGRFAKNKEEESQTDNNNVSLTREEVPDSLYTNVNKEEPYYDEEWLREAMSSFMLGSSFF